MPSLREIKDRIGSVRSTLKITSAMKLVASSKLRKAQRTIESLRPYEEALSEVVATLSRLDPAFAGPSGTGSSATGSSGTPEGPGNRGKGPSGVSDGAVAVVAISSNSSLCGGFNSTIIKKALEVVGECGGDVEVFSLGRKMADAMKKAGHPSPDDFTDLVAHPSFDKTSALAERLAEGFEKGEYSKVLLVYNHFVSTSKQVPVSEIYLPFDTASLVASGSAAVAADDEDYLLEPTAGEMLEDLLPRVMRLKLHTAVLDSSAAEQAARTVAMQTATDNAESLLGELTLEYNKGRQQKITSEILDLLGGSAQ